MITTDRRDFMKLLLSLCQDLAWGLQCVLLAYAVYNVLIAIPLFVRHSPQKQFAPQKRFAVLVAARNEEGVIGSLVESLLAQDYPRELFDVFVLPNNCTDDTEGAARRAGAEILTCSTPVACKGDVLRFAFDHIFTHRNHYDAFCIFDADNLAEPGFLRAMNNALCSGARTAQGRRDSKNPYDTAVTGSYSIYYWMFSRFYNHPRSLLGLSATINGCGFMISADLLREMGGFQTRTMTEDLEFTAQCSLRGVKVEWVPEAVFYDESPQQFLTSWKQRKRWSTGLMQCMGMYGPRLLGKVIRERDFRCLDQLIFLLAPLMQILSILPAAAAAAVVIFSPDSPALKVGVLFPPLLSLAASVGLATLGALATVFLERGLDFKMLRAIGYYWIFLFSWIPINILCLFKKSTVWTEIKHTRNIRLMELPAEK